MLQAKETTFNHVFNMIDVLISLMALFVSYYWLTGMPLIDSNREYLVFFLFQTPVWYLLSQLFNLHKIQIVRSKAEYLIDFIKAAGISVSAMIYALYLFRLHGVHENVFVVFIVLNYGSLYGYKVITNHILARMRRRSSKTCNVMMIAEDKNSYVLDRIVKTRATAFVVKAIVTTSPGIIEKYGPTVPIITDFAGIRKYLVEHPIHELHYCKDDFITAELRELVYTCQEVGVTFRIKSNLFNQLSTSSTINYLAEIPFITITNLPNNYLHLKIKRMMDIAASFLAIVMSFPFMLMIAASIKLTSKGPVFYCQTRSGLRGRQFKLYKFRTMVANSDELRKGLEAENEMDGPVFKIKNDPRITRVGLILRKTSMDEFPQFLNVLRGEMSVVGPRPPIPAEVKQYERWQLRRISVKPGITCTWQVSGRNDTTFEEWMRKDLEYIDNWSLKLDLIICLKTVRTILSMNGR